MPESKMERSVKKLLAEKDTEHEDVINAELGSPEGFDTLKRVAREEAQAATRSLRERHLLVEAAAQATANTESEIAERARELIKKVAAGSVKDDTKE